MTGSRSVVWPVLAVAIAVTVVGCHSPEDGRERGGGNGGDAQNYVPGKVVPPSKIDSTRDLLLLQHDGPRAREPSSSP
jgi:hypothetical protein